VQALVTAAGHTLVVLELVIDAGESHLEGKSLRAMILDYHLLPISLDGDALTTTIDRPLKAGDRLTVVAELPDVERLIRRQEVPAVSKVMIDSFPPSAKGSVVDLVQLNRGCTRDEAEGVVAGAPFTLGETFTRGEAQALVEQLARNGITARDL
jgi:hypothetical protein